jgi:hypothetical protein
MILGNAQAHDFFCFVGSGVLEIEIRSCDRLALNVLFLDRIIQHAAHAGLLTLLAFEAIRSSDQFLRDTRISGCVACIVYNHQLRTGP